MRGAFCFCVWGPAKHGAGETWQRARVERDGRMGLFSSLPGRRHGAGEGVHKNACLQRLRLRRASAKKHSAAGGIKAA
jgi:hypothetical protein